MAAVVAENEVAFLERIGNRDAHPFLPDAGVYGTRDFAVSEQLEQTFLGSADGQGLGEQSWLNTEFSSKHLVISGGLIVVRLPQETRRNDPGAWVVGTG